MPLLLFSALCLNVLILKILSLEDKRKKNFNERMYFFLRMNTGFNIFLIVRSLLSLLSDCVEINSVFCSQVRTFPIVQYFYIYFVNYFGSVARICSSVSILAFSFDRLSFNMTKKSTLMNLFNKVQVKHFFTVLVLLSLVINVPKIFKFNIVDEEMIIYHNSYPEFSEFFENFLDSFVSFSDLVIEVSNHLIIFTINIIIDALLLRQIKENLSQKSAILNMPIKQNRSLFYMVIINSILNLLFRLPMIASSLYSCVIMFNWSERGLHNHRFIVSYKMQFLNQVSEFSSSFTYFINFVILYNFNLKFRQSCHSFFSGKI